MTRGFPARPVVSVTFVLVLLASIGLASFVAPVGATASPETASNAGRITDSVTSLADAGPGPRFAFSVLDQGATTITKIICPNPGSCIGGGTTTTLNPGTLVSFQVTVANAQRSPVTITDFWQ